MLCTPSWVPASRLVPGLPLRPWSCTIFPYTTLFRSQYLQKTGVITGFTVTVNPARLGLGASAHVILKLRQHNWRALRQQLLDIPEVWHVTLTGGPMDVILLVRANDTADLRRVVFDEIQPLEGVMDTQTFMIFDDQVSSSALH